MNWVYQIGYFVSFIGMIFITIGFKETFKKLSKLQKAGFILAFVGIVIPFAIGFINGLIQGFAEGF